MKWIDERMRGAAIQGEIDLERQHHRRNSATLFYITILFTYCTSNVVTTALSVPANFSVHQLPYNYGKFKRPQQPIRSSRNVRSCLLSMHASTLSNIEISQVQSNTDVSSLADLRYHEWIVEDKDKNVSPLIPSQSSFRLATAEIYQERSAEGAAVFLAKFNGDKNNVDAVVSVVGAAEISPIELRGCITYYNKGKISANERMSMYATDVVTSSSHRRLGIGSKLMIASEAYSRSLGCEFVFLHVEKSNTAAITFYRGLGYLDVPRSNIANGCVGDEVFLSFTDDGGMLAKPSSTAYEIDGVLIAIKTQQLAINAGTIGQLLMVKQLKGLNDGAVNNSIDIAFDDKPKVTPAKGFDPKDRGFGRSKKNKSKGR